MEKLKNTINNFQSIYQNEKNNIENIITKTISSYVLQNILKYKDNVRPRELLSEKKILDKSGPETIRQLFFEINNFEMNYKFLEMLSQDTYLKINMNFNYLTNTDNQIVTINTSEKFGNSLNKKLSNMLSEKGKLGQLNILKNIIKQDYKGNYIYSFNLNFSKENNEIIFSNKEHLDLIIQFLNIIINNSDSDIIPIDITILSKPYNHKNCLIIQKIYDIPEKGENKQFVGFYGYNYEPWGSFEDTPYEKSFAKIFYKILNKYFHKHTGIPLYINTQTSNSVNIQSILYKKNKDIGYCNIFSYFFMDCVFKILKQFQLTKSLQHYKYDLIPMYYWIEHVNYTINNLDKIILIKDDINSKYHILNDNEFFEIFVKYAYKIYQYYFEKMDIDTQSKFNIQLEQKLRPSSKEYDFHKLKNENTKKTIQNERETEDKIIKSFHPNLYKGCKTNIQCNDTKLSCSFDKDLDSKICSINKQIGDTCTDNKDCYSEFCQKIEDIKLCRGKENKNRIVFYNVNPECFSEFNCNTNDITKNTKNCLNDKDKKEKEIKILFEKNKAFLF